MTKQKSTIVVKNSTFKDNSLFNWRLLLNRFSTRDNLVWRRVLPPHSENCTRGCGTNEDNDPLFITRHFYGRINCLVVSNYLGFPTVIQGTLVNHLSQFDGLGRFSKHARLTTIFGGLGGCSLLTCTLMFLGECK
jgi:hypothetical protein